MSTTRNLSLTRQLSMSTANLDRVLTTQYANLARLQEMVSTGKKLRRASDDPAAFGLASRLERTSARYDQFERSATAASVWANHTQDGIDHLAELFTESYAEGVRAANDTNDQAARDSVADRLDIIFDQVLDELNTNTPDGYLFAGGATDTRPFLEDGSGTADGAGVTYYGTAEGVERAIAPELKLKVSVSGADLVDTGNGYTITEALRGLIDAIRSGDDTAMDTAIGQISGARDHLIDEASGAGVTAERLSTVADQLSAAKLRVDEQHSQIADADLAETVIQLQRAQTGMQAALQAVGSMNRLSLLDYLS